jgi:hypothetical protein
MGSVASIDAIPKNLREIHGLGPDSMRLSCRETYLARHGNRRLMSRSGERQRADEQRLRNLCHLMDDIGDLWTAGFKSNYWRLVRADRPNGRNDPPPSPSTRSGP